VDIASWKFDPITAVVTVVVAPLLLAILKIVARHLRVWAAYAIEGLMYWIGTSVKQSLGAALSLKRYARNVLAGLSKELYVPASVDVTLQIDDIYVPLMLDHQGSAEAAYSHTSALAVRNRLRIVGDPGSGKSSFVKRILRDTCRMALDKATASKLPVWYELKRISLPTEEPDDWASGFTTR